MDFPGFSRLSLNPFSISFLLWVGIKEYPQAKLHCWQKVACFIPSTLFIWISSFYLAIYRELYSQENYENANVLEYNKLYYFKINKCKKSCILVNIHFCNKNVPFNKTKSNLLIDMLLRCHMHFCNKKVSINKTKSNLLIDMLFRCHMLKIFN